MNDGQRIRKCNAMLSGIATAGTCPLQRRHTALGFPAFNKLPPLPAFNFS
jgi:hypothetical protein